MIWKRSTVLPLDLFSRIKYKVLEKTSSQLKLGETKFSYTYKQSPVYLIFYKENGIYLTSTGFYRIS